MQIWALGSYHAIKTVIFKYCMAHHVLNRYKKIILYII